MGSIRITPQFSATFGLNTKSATLCSVVVIVSRRRSPGLTAFPISSIFPWERGVREEFDELASNVNLGFVIKGWKLSDPSNNKDQPMWVPTIQQQTRHMSPQCHLLQETQGIYLQPQPGVIYISSICDYPYPPGIIGLAKLLCTIRLHRHSARCTA